MYVTQGGAQVHVFSAVILTDSCMASLSTFSRCVLAPFPEKGTQNRDMFHRKANGMQAGRKPEEKERADAFVTDESKTRRV